MKVRCLLIAVVIMFVAGVLASSTHAAVDPKTVVGMWLFDDNKGTVATDSSVNKNVGTVKGTAQWVAGKFGSALQLDGKTGWVDCGDTASMAIPAGGSVTMCAWVNPTVGSVAAWQGIMAKRTGSYSYGINLVKGNFQIYTSGASGIAGFAYDLPVGQWVHVAATMSKNPTELYVNGVLFGTKGGGGGVALAANGLGIGASGTIGEFFNGIIDDVAIFNTVLTVDDVKSLMTKGLASTFGITAVESSGKLATSWASLKSQ
ncbi:MAG: hypothetical protein QG641_328 [Candidatus Poribacteria bacterium]|nr:hypothetical protein [Candidatus Poribacteria bacterium]